MAAKRKSHFNITTTCYENFLALSVSIRVDKHQLMMETPSSILQAPALRYKDITITTESLKECLSAVCPLRGAHNVARVREGALPLVEVDFTDEKALDRFCKSMSTGDFCQKFQQQLKGKIHGHEVDVTVKLRLIMPKKSPVSREVTTANYRECFSLIRESGHDIVITEIVEHLLGIGDLGELLEELVETNARWLTVGTFLKIDYYKLEAIRNDNHDSMDCLREMLATWLKGNANASPTALVQALISVGMVTLANTVATNHGVTLTSEANKCEDADLKGFSGSHQADADEFVSHRKTIATNDKQHSALVEQLTELKEREEKVIESLKETSSSLESVKDQIKKLRLEQKSLVEKEEEKQFSRRWLIGKRASMSGEVDLAEVNKLIRDIDEVVADINNQIEELEKKIKTQNEQVAKMKVQLVQKEKEKKQLETDRDKIKKEIESLEVTLEKDRKRLDGMVLSMAKALSENKREVLDSCQKLAPSLAHSLSDAQVKNEASKPKPQNVEDSASVDNAPLVSKGEKRPNRRQRALTSEIPPNSVTIDKLEVVNAQLLAQKEQQIDELNKVKEQLLAQKAQELQHINELKEVKAQLDQQQQELQVQIDELKEVKAQLAKTEQELQHLKPLKPHGRTIDEKDYFGIIDSSQAEAKCCNTGYYLVRRSAEQNKYFLTVNWKKEGIHIPIREIHNPTQASISYCIGDKYFGSVSEILDHYVKSQKPIAQKSGAVLTKFVSSINESLIRREDIKCKHKISSGVFGNVYKALFQNEQVVVKTCEHIEDRNRFLHEAILLEQYEHPNIVQLKGVVTEQFPKFPLYIITEIMSAMSLCDFLRKQATSYEKEQLRKMCTQVCAAMKYLEENGHVHCNLIAQNCIVDEHGFVKISGFGINRKRKNGMHKIFFKWASPEILNFGKYSSASDVWSFGVLTWEIFSLGATPYPGMTDKQVSQQIELGHRMSPPANCPDSVYNVMLKCWNYDEEYRPTFAKLYPMVCDPDIS